MNRFVHATLRHFLQAPITDFGDGGQGGINGANEEQEEEEQEEEEETDDDEMSLVIDGEKAEADDEADDEGKPAPSWVKDLRKANREDKKRIRELEDLVRKQQPPKASAPTLGKKPTLEDHDWDGEAFEGALTSWHETKRQIEEHERNEEKTAQQQKAEWEGRQTAYTTGKTALKFKDVADAEEIACAALDITQQGIILQGSQNSALLIYALGKNPKKASEMAAIKDPIKFAWAVAQLETKLKTETKKPKTPPAPEPTVRGQARITGAADTTLDRLREEANKTGDMSKVMAYKRAQKAKQK